MEDTVYKVSSHSDADKQTAIDILDAAFAQGEFRRIATGGDIALGRAQARAMAGAAFIGGEIYFARKQGKVVGVAAWYPPGRAAYDSEEAKTEVMQPFLDAHPQELKEWQLTVFRPGYSKLTDESFGSGYKLGSYHLQAIAVLPEYQGKGISRQLIEHVKDTIAHPHGIPVCLEATSQRNADIYSRIGFRHVGQGTFEGAASVGGKFTFYCMVSEPGRSG